MENARLRSNYLGGFGIGGRLNKRRGSHSRGIVSGALILSATRALSRSYSFFAKASASLKLMKTSSKTLWLVPREQQSQKLGVTQGHAISRTEVMAVESPMGPVWPSLYEQDENWEVFELPGGWGQRQRKSPECNSVLMGV